MILSALMALMASGCQPVKPVTPPQPTAGLVRLSAGQMPPLGDDLPAESLKMAMGRGLAHLKKLDPERIYVVGPDRVKARGLAATLEEARRLLDRHGPGEEFLAALRRDFVWYGPDEPALFTGYYEPVLEGRVKPEGGYRYPLLATPKDLVLVNLKDFGMEAKTLRGVVKEQRLVPYPDRAAIEEGHLQGQNLELAYVDEVEAFFLHIQGSGRVRFPDGREIRLNYAQQNGRPYNPLGAELVRRGLMAKDDVNMYTLKTYLRRNPGQATELMRTNPSYVFFRLAPEGPLGSYGYQVTPERTLALDRSVWPPDALMFYAAVKPTTAPDGRVDYPPMTRLGLNQDTGGAIKGAARADVFFGQGPAAELAAGMLKHRGRLCMLVLKSALEG